MIGVLMGRRNYTVQFMRSNASPQIFLMHSRCVQFRSLNNILSSTIDIIILEYKVNVLRSWKIVIKHEYCPSFNTAYIVHYYLLIKTFFT
jgi:hypothetical protein